MTNAFRQQPSQIFPETPAARKRTWLPSLPQRREIAELRRLGCDNAIIAGHPGVTFGIHICRGNHKSMFYASGGYDRIAEQVFRKARFDRFLLEYDDERSDLATC